MIARQVTYRPPFRLPGTEAEYAKEEPMNTSPVVPPITLPKFMFSGWYDRIPVEKPLNWTFKAGQCLDITLLDPSEREAEGNTRTFSTASAPCEENYSGPRNSDQAIS